MTARTPLQSASGKPSLHTSGRVRQDLPPRWHFAILHAAHMH